MFRKSLKAYRFKAESKGKKIILGKRSWSVPITMWKLFDWNQKCDKKECCV